MTQLNSPGAHSGTEKAEICPFPSSRQRQGYRHFDPSSSSSNTTNINRHQKNALEDADLTRSSTPKGQLSRAITFEEKTSIESPLPPSPPPPPPHDYVDTPVQLQLWHLDDEKDDHKLPPLPPTSSPPPPLVPSKRTFYQTALDPSKESSSTPFIEAFMARHPRISRHRRRFAALVFTVVTLLLLLIVLLSVLLTRKKSDDLGDYGDGTTATDEELARYNRGKSRPPINRSNDDRWARQGQGEGTYYDPSVKLSTGDFVMGACEFPFINSVHDMIAALNKPDFGSFPRAMNSPACGQCIRVTGPNGTVDVQIVDMCPGCKSGDVDLTPGAFSKIAHLDTGRVNISWQVCP
ncbi:hypothetical protein BGZ52_003469 [Haplosporangium bisporale]|nr:hypothetical protein BGZ52_003469 [Haplosporangium bisporale]KFH67603.1 hypothetical protein MVEG_06335 [Podila verticillata NRRL 6337]